MPTFFYAMVLAILDIQPLLSFKEKQTKITDRFMTDTSYYGVVVFNGAIEEQNIQQAGFPDGHPL
jgi:hypothetical protein